MKTAAPVLLAVSLVFGGQSASAQDLSRYRDYALGGSLQSILAASGAHPTEARTVHERPAIIQQLRWRAPFTRSGDPADPVQDVAFSFYNDALYLVVVTYDRQRTAGLTNSDILDSLSAAYGPAVLASARTRFDVPSAALGGSIVVARWQDAETLLTLVRAEDTPEFQLVLASKTTGARAQSAIREAIRLDAVEAPRRELEQRRKDASEEADARNKARVTNKAAFRP